MKKKSTVTIIIISVIILIVSFLDFYILPEVNFQRVNTGKKPILMFLEASYKDGGSKQFRGMSYRIFYHHAIQPFSEELQTIKYEIGPEISYLLHIPFRNEESKKEVEIKER